MTTIVLLAPTGQVGFELARTLAPLGKLITIGRQQIDFAKTDALSKIIQDIKADVIVNAAAYTMVDKAQTEPAQAFLINHQLPKALANIANQQQALLVHYSTDYVYAGDGDTPWQENDPTHPLSVYGTSKLAGDQAIMQSCQNHLIFRTSWVYGARGKNFMKTMLHLAKNKECLSIVNDQFGAPTPARLIAQVSAFVIWHMLSQKPNMHQLSGIYHLATKGVTSWYAFAYEIFTLAYKHNVDLMLPLHNIQSIDSDQYPTPAKRPKNSRLNVAKLEQCFGLWMPSWQSQLELTFNEWLTYQTN